MTAPIFTPHPGRRCKPRPQRLHRRALAWWRARQQARRVEAARQATADNQWAAILHEINTDGYLPAGLPAPVVATGPAPAAVLADQADERWPHLAPAYTDDTLTFGLTITEAGQ